MQEHRALGLHSSACKTVEKVKETNYTTPALYLSRQNECWTRIITRYLLFCLHKWPWCIFIADTRMQTKANRVTDITYRRCNHFFCVYFNIQISTISSKRFTSEWLERKLNKSQNNHFNWGWNTDLKQPSKDGNNEPQASTGLSNS
jgi:hypothetical protein